jgi:Holliday junction resolvasome RuvABC DNA-binding subunit
MDMEDMDRFINDQNLERLRKLANVSTTMAERKILFGLLTEEKTKFIELQKARIPVLISN